MKKQYLNFNYIFGLDNSDLMLALMTVDPTTEEGGKLFNAFPEALSKSQCLVPRNFQKHFDDEKEATRKLMGALDRQSNKGEETIHFIEGPDVVSGHEVKGGLAAVHTGSFVYQRKRYQVLYHWTFNPFPSSATSKDEYNFFAIRSHLLEK